MVRIEICFLFVEEWLLMRCLVVWKNYLPPGSEGNLVGMYQYIEKFGYYGPDTEKKVKWSASKARGKLTTLEEYFKKNPLNLE